MNLLVRTAAGPVAMAPAVRSVVAGIDKSLPITAIRTFDDVVDRSYGQPRFLSILLGAFAGLALVLMAAGVYGLLAFLATARLPEMGVRMALGASRSSVLGLVLREGWTTAAGGVAVGLLAALALGRFIEDQLFGVKPTDPSTFVAVAALVFAVVTAACWWPAWRAAKVDPISVLRQD
jgi:ABC-type antimicrobial peptide transport system permease subunit